MIHTLHYNFEFREPFFDDCFFDYDFGVDETIEDIVSYLFEKKYGKPYNKLSYHLEKGATKFVSDLETKWLQNKLDTFKLYKSNGGFINWLKEKYYADARAECYDKLIEESNEKETEIYWADDESDR